MHGRRRTRGPRLHSAAALPLRASAPRVCVCMHACSARPRTYQLHQSCAAGTPPAPRRRRGQTCSTDSRRHTQPSETLPSDRFEPCVHMGLPMCVRAVYMPRLPWLDQKRCHWQRASAERGCPGLQQQHYKENSQSDRCAPSADPHTRRCWLTAGTASQRAHRAQPAGAGRARGPHPPVGVVQREGEAVHDAVGVVAAVRRHLRADAEALQAQVEVRAHRALDAHGVADVLLAVVAVVQRPAPGPPRPAGTQARERTSVAGAAGNCSSSSLPTLARAGAAQRGTFARTARSDEAGRLAAAACRACACLACVRSHTDSSAGRRQNEALTPRQPLSFSLQQHILALSSHGLSAKAAGPRLMPSLFSLSRLHNHGNTLLSSALCRGAWRHHRGALLLTRCFRSTRSAHVELQPRAVLCNKVTHAALRHAAQKESGCGLYIQVRALLPQP